MAPFQLYSLATPNGQKIGILLEELNMDYDAFVVKYVFLFPLPFSLSLSYTVAYKDID